MLIDRGERIRLAGIAARHEGRFKMALGRELKAIGLSLLGLRLTLGICYPDELTPSAINRIFNYLSLAQPIQGQRPAPVERLTAVINALNSLSTHVHQHSRRE